MDPGLSKVCWLALEVKRSMEVFKRAKPTGC